MDTLFQLMEWMLFAIFALFEISPRLDPCRHLQILSNSVLSYRPFLSAPMIGPLLALERHLGFTSSVILTTTRNNNVLQFLVHRHRGSYLVVKSPQSSPSVLNTIDPWVNASETCFGRSGTTSVASTTDPLFGDGQHF